MRAVLVGMGEGAERILLPGLTRLPDLTLTAACDVNPANRERVAAKWKIDRVYDDAAAMLAAEQPDLVAIATPPMTHFEVAKLALEHGAHVFCEKPFMTSMAEADEIIRLASEKGRQVGVNNQYYQMPIFKHPLALITMGKLGRVYHIDAWQHMYVLPHTEGGWKSALGRRRVLLEFGTHAVDLICRAFGSYPQAVTARTAQPDPSIESDVCITVRLDFTEGRFATLNFNRASHAPMRYFDMRIDGAQGSIKTALGGVLGFALGWNAYQKRPTIDISFTRGGEAHLEQRGRSQRIAAQSASAFGDAAQEHLSAFIKAVETNSAPPSSIEHSRRVLETVLASCDSAENNGELVCLQPNKHLQS